MYVRRKDKKGLYETDTEAVTQMMQNMKVEKNVLINNDESDESDVIISDDSDESDVVVSDDSDDECVIQMMQNMKMKNMELGNVKDFEVSDDDEPNPILDHLNEIIKTLGDKIKENLDLLIGWKQEVQLYCVLKIYTTLGVPPTSELIQIQITPHTRSIGSYTIKDKKLLGILRLGIGHSLISDSKGLPFQDSDSFIDFITHFCGYSPDVLRDTLVHNGK
jgi:hypothetical protein